MNPTLKSALIMTSAYECGLCGKRPLYFVFIDNKRYCFPDCSKKKLAKEKAVTQTEFEKELAKKWRCPKCRVSAHPKKCPAPTKCQDGGTSCQGLVCECDEGSDETHGLTHADPCFNVHCYHCGWVGQLPAKAKKTTPWEKKALEAGWTPPKGWGK